MPESEISEQLAEAVVSYGLTDVSAWDIEAGRISTNVGPPPQGGGASDEIDLKIPENLK